MADLGWTTFYCAPLGKVVVLASREEGHWAPIELDTGRSVEHAQVWVARDQDGGRRDVAFVLDLDEGGRPAMLPAGFDDRLLGSMTLWPHPKATYVWWTQGAVRTDEKMRRLRPSEWGRAPFFDLPSNASDLQWHVEARSEDALRVAVARTDELPSAYRGGREVRGGEGETLYELDRPEHGEWLLIVDSGAVLDMLAEEDAGGLYRFTLYRFGSPDERARWRAHRGWYR